MSARKILTLEQKVAILRERLIENVSISHVCDKHGVSVVNFSNWQKVFLKTERPALNVNRTLPMSNGRRMPA